MTKSLNFQSIIMKLQEFWAEQGCLIWQPYYSQVGAGTMNPATVLRVLGPEPWNVAYVEPSIRPDDGRYGENPNRMQMHYQFQVILKPDPGNPQELYLKSLEALGIDPRCHDIRFVEDNWESPALGAWGLGWEVWLDGQEITQFTYFQQAGGQVLDPVSVEITYGLERIAIALQRVSSFRDIQWSPARTDGDVNLQAEQEHSKYYFEIADVARLRQMYDLFEAEANACLEQGLVLPAHDYILKCSHTFNVLDTRGAVGVTERQALFGRMRDLSRRVAECYVAQRQRLEFPWLEEEAAGEAVKAAPAELPALSADAPFLLEIGSEELPAGDLDAVLAAIGPAFEKDVLQANRLEYQGLKVYGTPRRQVIYVEKLAHRQEDYQEEIKGPPLAAAFDANKQPTQALLGWARKNNVPADLLAPEKLASADGRYVRYLKPAPGASTLSLLARVLPDFVGRIKFDKSMRWNSSNVAYSRPLRWFLALFGDQVVPFAYGGMTSANLTRGLRFIEPAEFAVHSPAEYFEKLAAQGIILDSAERRRVIEQQVQALAAEVKGEIVADPALLAEVVNLVEAPTALRGSFDPSHLQLPREVLISVMKKHQRYFPVETAGGLLPYFIAVRNGDHQGLDIVAEGNEHVIRARFTDAAFFVREDVKKPLEAYLPRLSTLTFQVKLGSMLDKTQRIESLVDDLVGPLGLSAEETQIARRAAHLCKADLATHMVIEMTSLQGLMGRFYALKSGESEAVAQALFEHYLPRYAGDKTPQTRPGLLVGVADRLDTLAGLFAAGLAPTGNKDPFAQRRAALGLVQNLIAWNLDFDLSSALEAAATHLPLAASPESKKAVFDFIVERLRNVLLEQGFHYDVVDAVVAAQGKNPVGAARAAKELSTWVARPDWNSILPTYARCVRITRDLKERFPVDEAAFVEEPERQLYAALQQAENAPRRIGSVDDFLNAFLPMAPAITRFFDTILVMAEEPRLRQNRLGMLQRIAALAESAADMSRLEGF